MLVPVLLAWPYGGTPDVFGHEMRGSHSGHLAMLHMSAAKGSVQGLAAIGTHTLGYLAVASLIALLVYEKLGVAILRRAWFNLDLIWMIALMVSGVMILLL
jgi:hypothetical protein